MNIAGSARNHVDADHFQIFAPVLYFIDKVTSVWSKASRTRLSNSSWKRNCDWKTFILISSQQLYDDRRVQKKSIQNMGKFMQDIYARKFWLWHEQCNLPVLAKGVSLLSKLSAVHACPPAVGNYTIANAATFLHSIKTHGSIRFSYLRVIYENNWNLLESECSGIISGSWI